MDPSDDYLRSLSGSSVSLKAFLTSRFHAALAVAKEAGLEMDFADIPPNASLWSIFAGAASAADEDLEGLEKPSDQYVAAVSALFQLTEMALLWEELISNIPPGQYEPLARAILLSKSIAYGEAAEWVRDKQFFEKLLELEDDRASRSRGALKTHANHVAGMQAVLRKAQDLIAKNPALSNDDLARKLIESGGKAATLTTPTVTKWLRSWRRDESLPAKR